MLKKHIAGLVLLGFVFDGCTTHDIKNLRAVNQLNEYTIAKDRAFNIRYNDTAYSQALEVYGGYLRSHLAEDMGLSAEKIDRLRIGVDNIYDKTGKVFGDKDGISDMVLASFAKLNLFPMVNLNRPSTYGNINIPENLFSGKYKNHKTYVKNPGLISQLPVGVLKPTDYYIAGALLQYDKKTQNKTTLDIKYASFGRDFDVIDVALDLRVVNSRLGIIPMPDSSGGKSSYVSLQNRVISFSLNGEYFKLIHDDAYGINISHEIGDPTQYAVREIVELAVLELVSKWTHFDWKETDAIRYVKSFHSQFVLKDR
ncbi:MAG TPA: hypothetical protein ENK66_01170 [Arcobacter sp.]|nr:hypothetical protein [Arcobacter sp.]